MIASVGVTAAPSPIIRPANASSGTAERSAAFPVIGLEMMIVLFAFVSFSAFSETVVSSVLVSVFSRTVVSAYVSGAVSR